MLKNRPSDSSTVAPIDLLMRLTEHPDVRTRLTADDDIAARLQAEVWIRVLAFKTLVNDHRLVQTPIPVLQACAIVDSWLRRPRAVVVELGDQCWDFLRFTTLKQLDPTQ